MISHITGTIGDVVRELEWLNRTFWTSQIGTRLAILGHSSQQSTRGRPSDFFGLTDLSSWQLRAKKSKLAGKYHS